MSKKKIIKRYMTLMEILIVIVIIGMISGVIAYNLSGSLETGKIFVTEQHMKQIEEVLLLESVTSGEDLRDLISSDQLESVISNSSHSYILKTPAKKLLKDGWNAPFEIELVEYESGEPGVLAWSKIYGRKKYKSSNDSENKNKYMNDNNISFED